MNTQPIADAPYKVGNNLELDEAILSTLAELTTRWHAFTADPMPDSKRFALQRLIMCGFAKTKVAYKVTNTTSSDWIRQRYVLSGDFLKNGANALLRFHASQCPRDWFEDDHVTPRPGVTITTESNDWVLAITDDGDKLRKLPDNRWLVLNTVNCHNARETILKDGVEIGRDIADQATTIDTSTWPIMSPGELETLTGFKAETVREMLRDQRIPNEAILKADGKLHSKQYRVNPEFIANTKSLRAKLP